MGVIPRRHGLVVSVPASHAEGRGFAPRNQPQPTKCYGEKGSFKSCFNTLSPIIYCYFQLSAELGKHPPGHSKWEDYGCNLTESIFDQVRER